MPTDAETIADLREKLANMTLQRDSAWSALTQERSMRSPSHSWGDNFTSLLTSINANKGLIVSLLMGASALMLSTYHHWYPSTDTAAVQAVADKAVDARPVDKTAIKKEVDKAVEALPPPVIIQVPPKVDPGAAKAAADTLPGVQK
jgi:hypothetical protein